MELHPRHVWPSALRRFVGDDRIARTVGAVEGRAERFQRLFPNPTHFFYEAVSFSLLRAFGAVGARLQRHRREW